MASSLFLRRSAALLTKSLQPLRSTAPAAPSVTRSFNTNAQLRDIDDNDQRNLEVNRRPDSGVRRRDSPPNFFSDVFDPFSPTRTLSQVLNMMDSLVENPFAGAASQGVGGGLRRGWEAKEEKDALHLRIDMPGLGKEDVRVSVEDGRLTIKGEGGKEGESEDSVRRYNSRIELPAKVYKLDGIKAEMKNGVLKVFVPKVKEDERKDVLEVNVD